jgi:hypothetical protein
MFTSKKSYPFDNRYKTYRILNFNKPYTNYKTYTIKYHPENTTNIAAIYVDNQPCNTISTLKSLFSTTKIDEKTSLLSPKINTKLIPTYFVEIHYAPEQKQTKLEYIMTESDINELLSKYDFGIKI